MNLNFLHQASGTVEGLRSGTVGNSLFSKLGVVGGFIGQVLVMLLIAGLALLFVRKMIQFDKRVTVFKRLSTGLREMEYKGRIFKDKGGKYKFHLTKSNPLDFTNKSISVMDQEYWVRAAKKEHIYLLQVGPDDYKPIKMYEEIIELTKEEWAPIMDPDTGEQLYKSVPVVGKNGKVKMGKDGAVIYESIPQFQKTMPHLNLSVMDIDASNHAIAVHREIVERHKNKSKYAVYAPMIMFLIAVIGVVALIWVVLGRIEGLSNAASAMSTAMGESAKTVAQTVSDTCKQVI